MYLAISQTVVSSALIREENKIQWPVYYTSQAFQGVEMKYPRMEKLAFALVVAFEEASYFRAHAIIVITDQPIKKFVSRPDAAAHMVQWVIKLSQLDIKYKPRIAKKAQALADFIAKFTLPEPDLKTE